MAAKAGLQHAITRQVQTQLKLHQTWYNDRDS